VDANLNTNVSVPSLGDRRHRARISIELGALKPRWEDHCRSAGLSSVERIRQLVLDALGQGGTSGQPLLLQPFIDDDGVRRRVEVRLTPSEFGAVEKLSCLAGMSVNRWIVAMIRVQITGEPQFGGHEMTALAESNHQLAALGRNLNQIARALNTAPDGFACHRLDVLQTLRADIDHHLDTVVSLIRANLERWSR
jgi:hypothetical protein